MTPRHLEALRRLARYGHASMEDCLKQGHSDETPRHLRPVYMGRADGFGAMSDALTELVELFEAQPTEAAAAAEEGRMKLTAESTGTVIQDVGRVWDATTGKGVKCQIVVAAFLSETDEDLAALQPELAALKNVGARELGELRIRRPGVTS